LKQQATTLNTYNLA